VPQITENELKQHIKSGGFASLYMICGEESYLKAHYVNRIAETAVDGAYADFNLHRFDGEALDFDALSAAVEAYPMIGGRSCVILKDAPLDALNKDDYAKLKSIFSDVPETCVLVLWQNRAEVQPKKNAKWKSILKDIGERGMLLELNRRTPGELARLITSGAGKRGCSISPGDASYMVSIAGDDMTNLLGELEKLCAYVGEGEIRRDDVDLICVKTVEAAVFDLVKALAQSDSGRAFHILATLFQQKAEPVVMMGAMISAYVDMYRVKVCQAAGGRPEDAAKIFDYRGKEFRLRNAARDSSRMSLAQVKECLDELSRTDGLLKGSGLDEKIVMEKCVAKLLLQSAKH